jgi:hypothetical protein
MQRTPPSGSLYGVFAALTDPTRREVLAAHLDIPLELAFVDLCKVQSRMPDLLAINRCGRTPVWSTAISRFGNRTRSCNASPAAS